VITIAAIFYFIYTFFISDGRVLLTLSSKYFLGVLCEINVTIKTNMSGSCVFVARTRDELVHLLVREALVSHKAFHRTPVTSVNPEVNISVVSR